MKSVYQVKHNGEWVTCNEAAIVENGVLEFTITDETGVVPGAARRGEWRTAIEYAHVPAVMPWYHVRPMFLIEALAWFGVGVWFIVFHL